MSIYTTSRSQPGKKGPTGGDDRELFMENFGQYIVKAWDETFDFEGETYVKQITSGKTDVFPIIGRLEQDVEEHVPGELIVGGTVEHNETEISLDAMLIQSAFIAEIDELLNHFPLSQPYGHLIGQSLASYSNARIGATMINASRVKTPPFTGGPVPGYYHDANILTDPAKLEEAAFEGVAYIRKNDIGGGTPTYWLPWQQQLLLARYTGIDTVDSSGSGNRSAGTVGQIAGISVKGTNSIPNKDITTGRVKYQGDFTKTVGVIANRMAVGTLRSRGLRVTMTNKEDRLGTLLIGSKLEGHGILRPECSFEVTSAERV